MKALIDADLIVYGVGFSTNDLDQSLVPSRVDLTIQLILDAVKSEEHQLFITMDGQDGFRYKVSPSYKGHRKQEKPVHYDFIRLYLIEKWGAKLCSHIEADDAIGIEQDKNGCLEEAERYSYFTIICSLDKDLDMLCGMHYRWPIIRLGKEVSPSRFYCVEEPEATRWFYTQMLTGDTSDNIKGIDGIGPVKAKQILQDVDDEQEMFAIVRDMYNDDSRFLMNGKLLWIMREVDDYWEKHFERLNGN